MSFETHTLRLSTSRGNKTENTFSLQSVSQVLQYTNFPSIRVHKFPKVQDTQLVQCPSHLSCPMSKFPKLSKPKLLKAQVTQSPSHPKLKLPKVQVAQIAKSLSCPHIKNGSPMAKNIYGPPIAKNISSPPMTKQNPSCPNFPKSKLLLKVSY